MSKEGKWVSVKDELPIEGNYVLVHVINRPWIGEDDVDGKFYKVAKLKNGITKDQRDSMRLGLLHDPKDSVLDREQGYQNVKRSDIYSSEDEHGNNKFPYIWETFGVDKFTGDEVDYWMYITPINVLTAEQFMAKLHQMIFAENTDEQDILYWIFEQCDKWFEHKNYFYCDEALDKVRGRITYVPFDLLVGILTATFVHRKHLYNRKYFYEAVNMLLSLSKGAEEAERILKGLE